MLSPLENAHHRWSASSRVSQDRLPPDRLDRASVAPAGLSELGSSEVSSSGPRGSETGMAEVSGPGTVAWKWTSRILGGTIAWLARRWTRSEGHPPRLAVVERLALSPKQWLLLVEADGVRLLISTSSEAPSTIFPLHGAPAGRSTPDGSISDGSIPVRSIPGDSLMPGRRPGSPVARPQAEGRISW